MHVMRNKKGFTYLNSSGVNLKHSVIFRALGFLPYFGLYALYIHLWLKASDNLYSTTPAGEATAAMFFVSIVLLVVFGITQSIHSSKLKKLIEAIKTYNVARFNGQAQVKAILNAEFKEQLEIQAKIDKLKRENLASFEFNR